LREYVVAQSVIRCDGMSASVLPPIATVLRWTIGLLVSEWATDDERRLALRPLVLMYARVVRDDDCIVDCIRMLVLAGLLDRGYTMRVIDASLQSETLSTWMQCDVEDAEAEAIDCISRELSADAGRSGAATFDPRHN
jgi:hypothetical protein